MESNLQRTLGLGSGLEPNAERQRVIQHIHLKLAALGYEMPGVDWDPRYRELTNDLLRSYQERTRLMNHILCPADRRIQEFLNDYLADTFLPDAEVDATASIPHLPLATFVLDRHGIARELAMPVQKSTFKTAQLESFRLHQGILHNPRSDRRTTAGSFHIALGGLPVPDDKLSVPKRTFRLLLEAALTPPRDSMILPFTADNKQPLESFVSLLLRPIVVPEVPGYTPEKTLEIRFFAPGTLVSNLDFVESIFGNAGDPELGENDAALDVQHWTGHTGCVILAPHLVTLRKQAVGLPHWDDATELERRDGMCWTSPDELYNGGNAFKLCCRDSRGVIVTIIADNYYGYCKKEVKTQISMSANLFGLAEEEHAGGAIVFPRFSLGDEFLPGKYLNDLDHTFADVTKRYASMLDVQAEGYAIDRTYPDILYIPEDTRFNLAAQTVSWTRKDGTPGQLKLRPNRTYVYPTGYKVHFDKHPNAPSWRLVGTVAEGTFCHKPCTVSGGGKSEISKSLSDAFIFGPFYVANLQQDLDAVEAIIDRNYRDRLRVEPVGGRRGRDLLSPERSLGSVIKLLTPSTDEFTDEYNSWLRTIPQHIRALVFIIKRFYRPEWGKNWRKYFTVDEINGWPGHELKYMNRKLVAIYLRVGLESDGVWRTYKLRQDFLPAEKIQMEDDITASIVVPTAQIAPLNPLYKAASVKLLTNCEYRFFQRPDDAVHRGYDRQAESDMASHGNFIVNFEPLPVSVAREMVDDAVAFSEYTQPMQDMIQSTAESETDEWFVISSAPRIVDGKPSKNPRYLQTRLGLLNSRPRYLAEIGTRLRRRLAVDQPVHFPVNAVLGGRRNNPPDLKAHVRALAVYNPIHYQELPELFMDFVCSLTGKSPSTTGAGSEGALTKGPFNCLIATADLNNALVSFILTGHAGFTSAAGYVGPNYRVDHDVSLLIPEVWCRMDVAERDPQYLIANRYLNKLEDFEYEGRTILCSRLGYRINERFVRHFFGRIFDNPTAVFNDDMLRPEQQDAAIFADGIDNIVEAQKRVAAGYFADGSVASACPPLKALLHIMVHGHYEGMPITDPAIRRMFTREYLETSDWYLERLRIKQEQDIALWERHVKYLRAYLQRKSHADEALRLNLRERLDEARAELKRVKSPAYLTSLHGTLGSDPIHGGRVVDSHVSTRTSSHHR